jgi:hypothetical protein
VVCREFGISRKTGYKIVTRRRTAIRLGWTYRPLAQAYRFRAPRHPQQNGRTNACM